MYTANSPDEAPAKETIRDDQPKTTTIENFGTGDITDLGKTEGTYRPEQNDLSEVLRHNAHLRKIIASLTVKNDVSSESSSLAKKDV